jgi:hypothetical protein
MQKEDGKNKTARAKNMGTRKSNMSRISFWYGLLRSYPFSQRGDSSSSGKTDLPIVHNCYRLIPLFRRVAKTMAFEFVPIQASEQPDLTEFLVKSFRADPTLTSFRPEVMHWKYFADHPEWTSPRSLAVKQAGQIVAHGGVWPVRLVTPKTEIEAIHLIDWAASRSAVGAGVQLLRKVAGLADVLLTIGGSQDTRNLLPKLGYKRCGELRRYARVVRPWLQFRTTPQKNWKTPIKFLRNSAQALMGIPSIPNGWEASKITRFTGSIDGGTIGQTTSSASPRRTAAALNRLLSCPAARFSGFLVSQAHRLRGYFLIAQVGKQARIADIRMDSEDREAWQAICALATRSAAEDDPETCEIVAGSSIGVAGEAWIQAGFVHRRTDQIFSYDPRNLLSSGRPLDLSLADGDLCFLSEPSYPYLS